MIHELLAVEGSATALESEIHQIELLDDDSIKERLKSAFAITIQSIVTIAACVKVLESRGHDLREFKNGAMAFIRKVAHGQLAANVIVAFQGRPQMIHRVSQLPMPDQIEVSTDAPMKVMIFEDGQSDHRMVRPSEMSAKQAMQVFANDHIRSESEQLSWIADHRLRSGSAPSGARLQTRIDPTKREVVISNGDSDVRIPLSRDQIKSLLRLIES